MCPRDAQNRCKPTQLERFGTLSETPAAGQSRLGDFVQQSRVASQPFAQTALELGVDLADAALGDAEDLADLLEVEIVEVKEDGDVSLARAQALQRGVKARRCEVVERGAFRIARRVGAGQDVQPLTRVAVFTGYDSVEGADLGAGDVLLQVYELSLADGQGVAQLASGRRPAVPDREPLTRAVH